LLRDGKTNGLSVPNADAHQAVIRQAYASAGLDLSETAMVEAHGTGTKMGDPLEAKAIGDCFRENGVYIGAVSNQYMGWDYISMIFFFVFWPLLIVSTILQIKPNLGHSEGAAALTSIIKAVLSLEHRTLLPNIKFQQPNPASRFFLLLLALTL
jgi:acyl transferase domain-containing protein